MLFRVRQEALIDAVQLANALQVEIRVRRDGDPRTTEVSEDGNSCDARADNREPSEIAGMRERIRRSGSALKIAGPRGRQLIIAPTHLIPMTRRGG